MAQEIANLDDLDGPRLPSIFGHPGVGSSPIEPESVVTEHAQVNPGINESEVHIPDHVLKVIRERQEERKAKEVKEEGVIKEA